MPIHFLILIVIIFLFFVIENYRETHRFVVKHYQIISDKLQKRKTPRTIVLLSDLHNQVYGKENEKLLESIAKVHPDVILIAGDMIVGHTKHSFEQTAKFVSELTKIARVYYANGNHEQRMKEDLKIYGDLYRRYRGMLTEHGVIMLENKSYMRDWDLDLASLYGLEIPMELYRKFNYTKLEKEEIIRLIGRPDPNAFNILIAHNPVHYKAYEEWGADLVVSGHLHGGLIRVPFLGGVITPQVQLFPKYSGGMYQSGNTTFVVSKGLGNHTVPIRIFNSAEVVVLHIDGKN